jgi:uncharacterized membrane protein
MRELESLLSNIPLEEREAALSYYSGYFEDAGEDHEEEIIKELISPEHVAAIIKADLNSSEADIENRGYFTEKGYQDTVDNAAKYELVGAGKSNGASNQDNSSYAGNNGSNSSANSSYTANGANNTNSTDQTKNTYQYNQSQAANQNTQQKNKNTNTGLFVIIGILTFPFWIPFVSAAFGIIIGITCALFGIIIGFGAAGVAMMASGVALIVAGLVQLSIPLTGLLFCGAGFFILGLGMLFMLVCVLLCKKVVPAFIRGIVNLCRIPFKNRSVMA